MAPLLTFYGDDFTGSSAVMEVLAFAGIPTTMFLDVPSPERLAKRAGIAAIGIAGISRSRGPAWMDAELPRFFRALKAIGAPILHYKTCSTFDSAPHLGSIGRAIEIGLAETGGTWTPLVVGAPAIGRYQMFGNLFAAAGGTVHRLDRHPVMACHPATPMHEADLLRHLAPQTGLPKALVDWRALLAGQGIAAVEAARCEGAAIIALDCFDEATLARVGEVLWSMAQTEAGTQPKSGTQPDGLFVTGSQGVEYALVAHFRETGRLPREPVRTSIAPAVPLLVVSGSCSGTTARQIAAAEAAGFTLFALDATQAVESRAWAAECGRVEALVNAALGAGRSVLVHTARGPEDHAITRFRAALTASAAEPEEVHERIGAGLGALVRAARLGAGIGRAIFSGGDSSGHGMLALGAEALSPIALLAPGVPLLRLDSVEAAFDGLEVALKGGQMGDDDLFIRAARGGSAG
jgi:uncharacterized protein YgbK (DUF1537 family)